ncbi:MAG: ABC transporter permease [Epsilonproteobacteria bacterium]|nr:ABC transporter permease [Campylobacterota bacterium]
MIKVCFLGIFIGTFSLMLTLIITNGFEKVISEKMQGLNAQIILSSPGNRLDYLQLSSVLKREFFDNIQAISGSSIKQALLEQDEQHTVLFLKGIDPVNEGNVTSFNSKITHPKQATLQALINENNLFIGHRTASDKGLSVGDDITLLIPEPGGKKKINLRKKQCKVGGIFNVGLEEYDSNFAFIDLETFNELFDQQGVETITLKLAQPQLIFPQLNTITQLISRSWWKDVYLWVQNRLTQSLWPEQHEQQVVNKLKQRFPRLQINTWKDLYPSLASSLKLEKYVSFFVLALITLVACMNMVSLLFMHIEQKRPDIALLKTIGMSHTHIRSIFIRIGLSITLFASSLGLACAAIAGYCLQAYPFIKLPDVYFVSHLPARMDCEIFVVVFLATLLLGFLATWLPAQRATKINVTQVLRHE